MPSRVTLISNLTQLGQKFWINIKTFIYKSKRSTSWRSEASDGIMSQLKTSYEQLIQAEQNVEAVKNEVNELRRVAFGAVSAKEDVAKKFFSELAESSEEIIHADKEYQEKKDTLDILEKELEDAKQNFLRTLTEIRFPFKFGAEGIETNENETIFHYDTGIDESILNRMADIIGSESLSSENIEIRTDGIVVKNSQTVTEAMEIVLQHVEARIRKASTQMLEVDKYVTELKNRDYKIQRMLYALFEADDEILSRKDMEIKSKLEKGELRGVLYAVLDRDPYVRKVGTGRFTLTEIGRRVMQRYAQMYGSPIDEVGNISKPLTEYSNSPNKEDG